MHQFGGTLPGCLASPVVTRRGGRILVASEALDDSHVSASVEQATDEGTSQVVGREGLDACLCRPARADDGHRLAGQPARHKTAAFN